MRRALIALVALVVLTAGAYLLFIPATGSLALPTVTVNDELRARGAYLLHAGGCVSCHSREEEPEVLAGGRALATPFGTFYTPNITPDRETGIGAWSDEEFVRAFRYGVSPTGTHYYPAFPYPSYTGVSDEDLLAIKAYLFSLPVVTRPNTEHDLVWYAFRPLLAVWKALYLEPGVFQPDPAQSEDWNRGAYLVRHLGHCGECHSPRTALGGQDESQALAGNPDGPDGEAVPNITPHETGLQDWSEGDIRFFLELGMMPDGDFVGGSMAEVIDDNTSRLSATDRTAIAAYLQALPPRPSALP